MLEACLAAVALAVAPLAIKDAATEVAVDAKALSVLIAQPGLDAKTLTPALEDFATESLELSAKLRAAGVTEDLPCIFKGIGEDARARGAEIASAQGEERARALRGLAALLSDAIELAPMAEIEARKAQR